MSWLLVSSLFIIIFLITRWVGPQRSQVGKDPTMTFCLLTLSDLGANLFIYTYYYDIRSTYGCKHLAQVAPKTDNSFLYFFSFTFCSQPFVLQSFIDTYVLRSHKFTTPDKVITGSISEEEIF